MLNPLYRRLCEHGLLLRFVMLCRFEINCYVTVPTLLLFVFVNLQGQMRKPNNKTEVQVWRLSPPLSINRRLLFTLIYQSVKICFNFLFAPTNNPLQLSLYSATPPVYLLPRICPLQTDRWFKQISNASARESYITVNTISI